jgi:hypothetical protein
MSDERRRDWNGSPGGDEAGGSRATAAGGANREARGAGSSHGGGNRGLSEEFDREIEVRPILVSGAVLGLIVILALAGMGLLARSLKARSVAEDPAPSPIAEANEPQVPPNPRLQVAPPKDMREFLAEENALLEGYGWTDKAGGFARIPIDRAIDLAAGRGLPPAGPMPPPTASSAPAGGGPSPQKGAPQAPAPPAGGRP